MPKRIQRDLRDFWPWYERSLHVRTSDGAGGHAQPPPFELADVERPTQMSQRQRLFWQTVSVMFAAALPVIVMYELVR